MILHWLKRLLARQQTQDLSAHRLHTTKYEDLCM